MTHIISRRPLLQSTSAQKEDRFQARFLKDAHELSEMWGLIFARRRIVERDDRKPIRCEKTLANILIEWQYAWFRDNLTGEQHKKSWSVKTSIFNVYAKRQWGTQFFVMAPSPTGVSWAPPTAMLNDDLAGAIEHVSQHFARWTRQLARAASSPHTPQDNRSKAAF